MVQKTIKAMFFQVTSIFFVLYSLFMIYAIIGTAWFGGKTTRAEINRLQTLNDNISDDYLYLNFNDFINAFFVLFVIMVGNDWQTVVSAFSLIEASNHLGTILYFVSFQIFSM